MPAGSFEVLKIKEGMPSVEEARQILLTALREARQNKVKALKLIHGHGSSGVGGSLRHELRKSLSRRMKEGLITCFVTGEKWTPLDERTRKVLEVCPELRQDRDIGQYNPGVTIILL